MVLLPTTICAGAAVLAETADAGVKIADVEPATTTNVLLPEVTTTIGILSIVTVVPSGTVCDAMMMPGTMVALPLMVVLSCAD